jgi:putative ABC transport system permease protein
VRAYLEGKVATIATLKTLGAEGRTIFQVYLLQIGALTLLGVALGLALGAGLVMAFSGVIEAACRFPAEVSIYPGPLAEAAFYGLLTADLFTLWPLARTETVRAAALYRGGEGGRAGRARAIWWCWSGWWRC